MADELEHEWEAVTEVKPPDRFLSNLRKAVTSRTRSALDLMRSMHRRQVPFPMHTRSKAKGIKGGGADAGRLLSQHEGLVDTAGLVGVLQFVDLAAASPTLASHMSSAIPLCVSFRPGVCATTQSLYAMDAAAKRPAAEVDRAATEEELLPYLSPGAAREVAAAERARVDASKERANAEARRRANLVKRLGKKRALDPALEEAAEAPSSAAHTPLLAAGATAHVDGEDGAPTHIVSAAVVGCGTPEARLVKPQGIKLQILLGVMSESEAGGGAAATSTAPPTAVAPGAAVVAAAATVAPAAATCEDAALASADQGSSGSNGAAGGVDASEGEGEDQTLRVARPASTRVELLNAALTDPVKMPSLPQDYFAWEPYPETRRALRAGLLSGRAVLLTVSSGSSVIAELNKLWHWVTPPTEQDAAAGVVRCAIITYGTRQVMHVAHELFPGERDRDP
jgi:hypothetical protein